MGIILEMRHNINRDTKKECNGTLYLGLCTSTKLAYEHLVLDKFDQKNGDARLQFLLPY